MSSVWCTQILEPNVLYDNLTFSVFVGKRLKNRQRPVRRVWLSGMTYKMSSANNIQLPHNVTPTRLISVLTHYFTCKWKEGWGEGGSDHLKNVEELTGCL